MLKNHKNKSSHNEKWIRYLFFSIFLNPSALPSHNFNISPRLQYGPNLLGYIFNAFHRVFPTSPCNRFSNCNANVEMFGTQVLFTHPLRGQTFRKWNKGCCNKRWLKYVDKEEDVTYKGQSSIKEKNKKKRQRRVYRD